MNPQYCSKFLLRTILENFDVKSFNSNVKYLEDQLSRLEKLKIQYAGQSVERQNPPRVRARARDLEQNAAGLINGIKFALSFMSQKDEDLDSLIEGVKI